MRVENNAGVNRIQRVRSKLVAGVGERGGSGSDSVELSTRAADIRAAMEALRSAPAVREEKVAELRGQIEQGNFDTQADALAAKLIQGAK